MTVPAVIGIIFLFSGASVWAQVATAPTITAQPQDKIVNIGTDVSFTVMAGGTAPLLYQWKKDGSALPGATSATLALNFVLGEHAGRYSVIVSNAAGSVESNAAELIVAGPPGIVRVATGAYTSFLVDGEGKLLAAGANGGGALGDGTFINRAAWTEIAQGVVSVSAGPYHTAFLKADGTLWTMGVNNWGQLGTGAAGNSNVPTQIASQVVKVTVSEGGTWFLKENGTLWGAGVSPAVFQNPIFVIGSTPAQIATEVADFSTSGSHILIVKTDGTLHAGGRNLFGQLGLGVSSDKPLTQVATGVAAVATGQEHSLFLKFDGTLWAMGFNEQGQLGDGTTTDRWTPVRIATNVRSVSAGARKTQFFKLDGTWWETGRLDRDWMTPAQVNAPVQRSADVTSASSSFAHSLYALKNGIVRATGENEHGQLTVPGIIHVDPVIVYLGILAPPAAPTALQATDTIVGVVRLTWGAAIGASAYEVWRGATADFAGAVKIAEGVLDRYFLDTSPPGNATVYYWVRAVNPRGVTAIAAPATGKALAGAPVAIVQHPTSVQGFPGLTLRLRVVASGSEPIFYQWYRDGVAIPASSSAVLEIPNAQLSDTGEYHVVVSNAVNEVVSQTAGVRVSMPQGVIRVAAGSAYSIFLRADGSLWGAGSGYVPNSSMAPHRLLATDVVDVTASTGGFGGPSGVYFLKADGTLWSCDVNYSHGLVAEDVAKVTAGGATLYFIKKDGSLWSFSTGQPVKSADDVVAIAAGGRHGLHVKSDGTLWADGYGAFGATGTGNSWPYGWTQIATNVARVAAGQDHSLFIKTDGTLWGMGRNGMRELGIAGAGNEIVSVPTQLAPRAEGISGSYGRSVLWKNDGALYATGLNQGVFGNGSTADLTEWTQIVLSGVVDVAVGGSHQVQARADGSAWASGANSAGQLGDGTTTTRTTLVQVAGGAILAPMPASSVAASYDTFMHGVRLQWNAAVGATGYEVWRGTSDTVGSAQLIASSVDLPLYLDRSATPDTDYRYWVRAMNPAGASAYSPPALGRRAAAALPQILTQPQSVVRRTNSNPQSMTVVATGPGPLTYRWHRDGVAMVNGDGFLGVTTPTLSIGSNWSFGSVTITCVVTNPHGSVTSAPATLEIGSPPTITQQPQAASVGVGGTVSLSVSAYGVAPTFRWLRNGAPINDASSSTLRFEQVTDADAGLYAVEVSNLFGTTTSNWVQVSVVTTLAAWRGSAFTAQQLSDLAISGPTGDPDGDGFANLAEYALGLQPQTPDGAAVQHARLEGPEWVYTYTRPANRPDLQFAVQKSADLVSWNTSGVTHQLISEEGGRQTWEARALPQGDSLFFRLKITEGSP